MGSRPLPPMYTPWRWPWLRLRCAISEPAATRPSSTRASEPTMRDFPLTTACTLATVGALLAVINPPTAMQLQSLVEFTPELTPLSPLARHVDPAAAAVAPRVIPRIAEPLLEDSGGVLDAFYHAL